MKDLIINGVIIPECQRQKCEIWTRVMGYHRPVNQWNKGKVSEYKERNFFKEYKAINSIPEKVKSA